MTSAIILLLLKLLIASFIFHCTILSSFPLPLPYSTDTLFSIFLTNIVIMKLIFKRKQLKLLLFNLHTRIPSQLRDIHSVNCISLMYILL
uniref:SJCHGC09746 protein n=1 Tax=Schistosoma japonicum TaxID=6182 RepID=Q5BQZ7_SCHJA|nr:SJCHGC09746 protein [Schistosoma japonicum]